MMLWMGSSTAPSIHRSFYYDTMTLSCCQLHLQGEYTLAEVVYELSQAIMERAFGLEHPMVAIALGNRAGLLKAQVRASKRA